MWRKFLQSVMSRMPLFSRTLCKQAFTNYNVIRAALTFPVLPLGRLTPKGRLYPTGPKVRGGTIYRWLNRHGKVVTQMVTRRGNLVEIPGPLGDAIALVQVAGLVTIPLVALGCVLWATR